MNKISLSGAELKKLRQELRLQDVDICSRAMISISTLYKLYNDSPTIRNTTRKRVEEAFDFFRNQQASA